MRPSTWLMTRPTVWPRPSSPAICSAAQAFIDRVDTGQVSVNLPTAGWDVHQPFGGFGDSGSPFKEQGASGMRFYTRLKTAAVRHAW